MVQGLIALGTGLAIFFMIGWLTGDEEFGGVKTNDDERSQMIKQKAITSSWILLITFFLMNVVFTYFKLLDQPLNQKFTYPELIYLLIALISYFICYWLYNRRLSSYEK